MTDVLLTDGGRLRLRRPTMDDLALACELHGDPEANRFNPAGPDADPEVTAERLRSWLAGWDRDGISYHVVEVLSTGEAVGFTGVRYADARDWGQPAEPVLNLYYRFAPVAWGRGYAAECGRTVLDWTRVHRPDRPVVVITTPDNLPSLKVARSLGFDHYRDITHDGVPSVEYRTKGGTPATSRP